MSRRYYERRPPSTGGLRIKRESPRYGTETHCPNGHEFTIHTTLVQDNGSRLCKVCKYDRVRRYNRHKRGYAKGLRGQELEDYVNCQVSQDKAWSKFVTLSAMYDKARTQKG